MRSVATILLLGCLAMAQSTAPAAKAGHEEKKSGGCCCGEMMAKGDKAAKSDKDAKEAKGGCCGSMGDKEGSMCARQPMKDDKPAEKKK